MRMTRLRSARGKAATSSGRTPTKRINMDGTIFSAAHQAKFPPALTNQKANLLPRLASIETGLVGERSGPVRRPCPVANGELDGGTRPG
jgi:hypothetical protein